MIKFSRSQLKSAYVGTDDRFCEWYIEQFMKTHLPQYYFSVSTKGKRDMVANGQRYAREFGFKDPEAQAHFITLMWEIGPNFYTFPGFNHVLSRTDVYEMDKIDLLFDGTVTDEQAVEAIMNPDDRYWFRENINPEHKHG